MRKATIVLGICAFLLIYVVSLGSQEKALGWADKVLRVVKPQPMDLSPAAIAIQNINRHLEEVARLRLLGVPDNELAVQLKPQVAASGTGSISGTVSWDHEHSISVQAYDEYGQYAGYDFIFSSDLSGAFTFLDLPPGKYYVRTNSDYYEDRYYRNTTDWKNAKLVKVKKGKATHGIDLAAQPYWGNGSITGHVKDKKGAPLSDCWIVVYKDEFNYIRSAEADAGGMYTLNNLPGGEYKLNCHYGGPAAYVREWYRDASSYGKAETVTVTGTKTTAGIDFVLELAGSIQGKIVDYKGKKVEQYNCSVSVYDKDKNYVGSAATDEKGSFRCDGLRPGAHKLYVSYRGAENCFSGWHNNAKDFNKAKVIRVKSNKSKNVKVILKQGGAITGKVVDYAGRGLDETCSISAYDEYGTYVKDCLVGENGIYILHGLPTGYYKLYADESGFYSRVGDQPASEWYSGTSEFSEAQTVSVKVPQTTPNINFSLEQGGYIGGHVTPPRNKVPQWGSVVAYDRERRMVRDANIAYDGRYFITGLASGEYRLQTRLNIEGKYVRQWYGKSMIFESAKAIEIIAPNAVMGIDITVENPGYMKGYLLDSKKKRVYEEGHATHVFAYNAASGDFAGYDANTFVGGYTLKLLGGKYKVGAVPIYIDWMEERDRLAAGYYRNGKSFYDPRTQVISHASGSTRKLKSLALKNADGAISGTVYDMELNKPITDGSLIIWVFDADGYLMKVYGTTEWGGLMSGDYVAPGLRPGTYFLLLCCFKSEGMSDEVIWQWYNGVEADVLLDLFIPKIDIPSGAYAVLVGNGEIQGIDFYIDRSK